MKPVIEHNLDPKSKNNPHSPAERLKKCFELAPPSILYNWHEEVLAVQRCIHTQDIVLDIGCGYGRFVPEFARSAKFVIGIDPVREYIRHGREWFKDIHNCLLLDMNPESMSFAESFFTKVICIQSNRCLTSADPLIIIKESLRVLKSGHDLVITVYNEKSWDNHLAWYEIQSRLGLIGEIDYKHSRPGWLSLRDGTFIRTVTNEQCHIWANKLKVNIIIEPISDYFSLCTFQKHKT